MAVQVDKNGNIVKNGEVISENRRIREDGTIESTTGTIKTGQVFTGPVNTPPVSPLERKRTTETTSVNDSHSIREKEFELEMLEKRIEGMSSKKWIILVIISFVLMAGGLVFMLIPGIYAIYQMIQTSNEKEELETQRQGLAIVVKNMKSRKMEE